MFRINNNDFKILQKYKTFLMNLDNSLKNIPRKDMYFKDRIKNISLDVLKDILLCSYDTSSVKMYRTSIKANIALLDFMLERLLLKKYISEKNLYKLATPCNHALPVTIPAAISVFRIPAENAPRAL